MSGSSFSFAFTAITMMLLATFLLANCQDTGALDSSTLKIICTSDVAKPIFWHEKDTPETIDAINRHNGAYECACLKSCPETEVLEK